MRAEILVGPERRRRWSVEQKLRIVGEAFAAEAGVAEVARRHDVARSQIYQWRAALRDGGQRVPGSGVVGFMPVEVTASSPMAPSTTTSLETGQPVEIGLVGGRVLKVSSSLPTAALRRLIRAVEGA